MTSRDARSSLILPFTKPPAWQSNCPNLGDVMSKAKDESKLTDVQFVIERKSSKKIFNAHKIILANSSEVFEKMFYGQLAEQKNHFVIKDDPEAFDMLLNYMYGKGENIKLNFLKAWLYYSIGDQYLVDGIVEDAKRFIKLACLRPEEFWNLIENGLAEQPIFKDKIYTFIHKHAHKILKSQKFCTIPENFVAEILLMDKLNVFEFELLQPIVKWVKYNVGNERQSQKMIELLKHVRFSILTVEEFCTFTDNFPDAIDARSCLEILKYLINKSIYKLPDWCTTNDNPRKDFRNVSRVCNEACLM